MDWTRILIRIEDWGFPGFEQLNLFCPPEELSKALCTSPATSIKKHTARWQEATMAGILRDAQYCWLGSDNFKREENRHHFSVNPLRRENSSALQRKCRTSWDRSTPWYLAHKCSRKYLRIFCCLPSPRVWSGQLMYSLTYSNYRRINGDHSTLAQKPEPSFVHSKLPSFRGMLITIKNAQGFLQIEKGKAYALFCECFSCVRMFFQFNICFLIYLSPVFFQ